MRTPWSARPRLAAGLSDLGAVLVGLVNAVGGGVLRDIITREEPVLFKPGQFYATAAAIGSALYVGLRSLDMHPEPAAFTAGGVAIAPSPTGGPLRLANAAVVLVARARGVGGVRGIADWRVMIDD